MTVTDALVKNCVEITRLFREALTAKLQEWDAAREIEKLLGHELSLNDLLENVAAGLNVPADVATVKGADIIGWLRDELGTEGMSAESDPDV